LGSTGGGAEVGASARADSLRDDALAFASVSADLVVVFGRRFFASSWSESVRDELPVVLAMEISVLDVE
jgi:hypothetical protein